MEKLNLYTKKIPKISLQKFLVYLAIALIPFISIMFYSFVWSQWKINEIAIKYPKVFNIVSVNDIKNAPQIIKSEIVNYNNKILGITKKIESYHDYYNETLRSKYFLQVLLNEFNNITSENNNTEFFIDFIQLNSNKYFVRFYEFSESPQLKIEDIIKNLKVIYKDPSIYLNSTKTLFGTFKMFEYILEGSL
ncbi:MAG: hypothetical protein H0Z22_00160 [Thermosipho sp. (in: Bacteria)]|nr:hypothetical protein [Thermosipho sp. (in: thermotogales)]